VNRRDVVACTFERTSKIWRQTIDGALHALARHLERLEFRPVESRGEIAQRVVAARSHVANDRRDTLRDSVVGANSAVEQPTSIRG
jgi:hypothetical protein